MKISKYFFYLVVAGFISAVAYAFQTGITGQTLKTTTEGCNCHGPSPSPSVSVTINGPSTLETGETGNYTVIVTGGPLSAAGTNIAASSGSVLTPGSGL
jgi:hypothetical protein